MFLQKGLDEGFARRTKCFARRAEGAYPGAADCIDRGDACGALLHMVAGSLAEMTSNCFWGPEKSAAQRYFMH